MAAVLALGDVSTTGEAPLERSDLNAVEPSVEVIAGGAAVRRLEALSDAEQQDLAFVAESKGISWVVGIVADCRRGVRHASRDRSVVP